MKIELIICTYMRPDALCKLLNSIENQILVPDYVTVVDGSINNETDNIVRQLRFSFNVRYFKVNEGDRGLTRQRNFGISKIADDADVIAFLDDDTVLLPEYFYEIVETFKKYPEAVGVGGYVIEPNWIEGKPKNSDLRYFFYDGWYRRDSGRLIIRKLFGLGPSGVPCVMPPESHGRSLGSLPPSGKTYPVESFMGCGMAFLRGALIKTGFSTYFEGYGLYEDLDFCIRVGRFGKLYVNTKAKLHHYHEPSGRPNRYSYGKMVVRNGWYVWRLRYGNPYLTAKLKWWLITVLQTAILFSSFVVSRNKMQSLTEAAGRFNGMLSLLIGPPEVVR